MPKVITEKTSLSTPEALKRLWSVGVCEYENRTRVLVSIGDMETGFDARGAADFMGIFAAAFDSAFPSEFQYLQNRMAQIIAMEAKDGD